MHSNLFQIKVTLPARRRWKPMIAMVAFWLFFMLYLVGDDPVGLSDGHVASSSQSGGTQSADGQHPTRWRKLPDRYSVVTYSTLPSGAVDIPKIQKWPRPSETAQQRRVRQERQAAVKELFVHCYKGYTENAWMQDEVSPLTGRPKNTFGGWAATLVDALDTLWIMGMKDEFETAVKACENIDFTYTPAASINVFETTIRYLGGFLGAYEISDKRHPSLLKKAIEVGELLMCAFDTPNRLPITRWEWQR